MDGHDVVHMAGMGLLTSVVAPTLILLTRRRVSWRPLSWPAAAALPFFLALHAAVMIRMSDGEPPLLVHTGLEAVLVAGAIVFWLPVLGPVRRLDGIARCVYLFLAAPALDLAGVVVVARGDAGGGLAMIVGMLPIGLAAVGMTWRVLREDEARARALDLADAVTRPSDWVATSYTSNDAELVEPPRAQP